MAIIELHILQNVAPSNLNRDDTGAPKNCVFGGYQRARISSQALKRAMRTAFREGSTLPTQSLGVRTKRLVEQLEKAFVDAGKDEGEAVAVAERTVQGLGLGLDGEKTQYLLFMGREVIDQLAAVGLARWEALVALPAGGGKKGKADVPKVVQEELGAALERNRAADVALFGRMLADLPAQNVDAASQVAHAISTHEVNPEFDFYTAVDDLNPEDTAGAGMMGTIEYNSACFYRYLNVDRAQLLENLNGDEALASRALAAFVDAAIRALPTGKQNSFAAHNPPSFVLAVVRPSGFENLANAFMTPIRPSRQQNLVQRSVEEMVKEREKLAHMYASPAPTGSWVATTEDMDVPGAQRVSVPELIEAVVTGTTA
ncbi:MAG TPA: type I-E CRISPR-associated protein Cas7/Cse4/CasC [Chloroflexota bacterium]|nr:type I-E CRISPR-associated protein Cas7/Cse4/CasC [Chloroflexota bacterium]